LYREMNAMAIGITSGYFTVIIGNERVAMTAFDRSCAG
jgi:hypothetical protein